MSLQVVFVAIVIGIIGMYLPVVNSGRQVEKCHFECPDFSIGMYREAFDHNDLNTNLLGSHLENSLDLTSNILNEEF